MTRHEFLTWAVPFFTITTILGAACSIMRLLAKRSKRKHDNYAHPHAGVSSLLTFQSIELVEKGTAKAAAFVYIMAAIGFVFAVCGSLILMVHQ